MKKKIRWCKLTDTDLENFSNRIKVNGEKERKIVVKVIDEKGNEITRFQDVKVDKHKILITMRFQWEVIDFKDVSEEEVEYIMKRDDDCWKIEEEEQIITVKKEGKFKRVWKGMHGNLLRDKFGDKIEERMDINNTDMECRISDSEESTGFRVSIYCKGESSKSRDFSWEKVKIDSKYHQNKEVGIDDIIETRYQKESKKSSLTKGWIAFFIIISLIIVSLIFFRKKIWNWIRGESKQEKKIREQLDIF